MSNEKAKYVEPSNYFPKELRKKHGVGEFNEDEKDTKTREKENKELRKIIKGE